MNQDQDKQVIAIGLKWGIFYVLFCIGMYHLCRATDSTQPYADPWYVSFPLLPLFISTMLVSGFAIRELTKKISHPTLVHIYGVGFLLFMIGGMGRFLYQLSMEIKLLKSTDRAFLQYGMGYVTLVVICFLIVIILCSWWKLFKKFDISGWYALIPIVNLFFLYKIANKQGIFFASIVIPILFLITYFTVVARLSKKFGRPEGFEFFLYVIPFIYYPIIAFSPENPQHETEPLVV